MIASISGKLHFLKKTAVAICTGCKEKRKMDLFDNEVKGQSYKLKKPEGLKEKDKGNQREGPRRCRWDVIMKFFRQKVESGGAGVRNVEVKKDSLAERKSIIDCQ